MKKNSTLALVGIAAAALVVGLGIGRFSLSSSPQSERHASTPEVSEPSIWTCSMHPQIQQPEAGSCPICGMDLIPLEKDSHADDGPRTMSMSESSKALAEIQTSPVLRGFPTKQVRLVGKLAYDQTREKSLTARFPARIDELFVNYNGISVKQGEHLAKVYSPELLTAQRELLTSYRSDPNSSITAAAREKLRLWDLLPDQIEAIIQKGEARDHFVLRAPIGGVVVSKNVQEGDYVKTGEALFRIVDLSVLWLYLDAYESDLAWLRYGEEVAFTVQAFPGEAFSGKIAFIEPEVDAKTRTVQVRVNVSNPDQRLKPGMFATGHVAARLAGDGKIFAKEFAGKWISPMHPEIVKDGPGQCDVCGMDLVPAEDLGYVRSVDEQAPMYLPASAVLRTGKRSVVYVEKQNTQRPTYEGREIVIGPRAGDNFIVSSGLAEGERVVTNGAFKIDSSLQILAKPSMMNPDRGEPATEPSTDSQKTVRLEIAPALANQLLEAYLEMHTALAGDDWEAAKSSANKMMDTSGHEGALPELLHKMLAAKTLDAFRKPHFELLSDAMIEAAKAKPEMLPQSLSIMHCPMVYGDHGADWLQKPGQLLNPYFGATMLTCGEVKETIEPKSNAHEGHDH